MVRTQPAVDHRIINRLAAEADPKALGGTSLADVLAAKLGISKVEGCRRIKQAELLGPRRAITGEPLAPKLANTAAAQARGQIGREHVCVIEKFFHDLPSRIDGQTRDQAEADLARIAKCLGPTQWRAAADRLALLLNQDGEPPDEAERTRRRDLTIDKQDADGMSRIYGLLDPEAPATIDAVLAKLAAPGMCNPEDEAPCVDGGPGEDAVRADTRSPGQRNHDALKAMGRSVLASGELGRHNGLLNCPATKRIKSTRRSPKRSRSTSGTPATREHGELLGSSTRRLRRHREPFCPVTVGGFRSVKRWLTPPRARSCRRAARRSHRPVSSSSVWNFRLIRLRSAVRRTRCCR